MSSTIVESNKKRKIDEPVEELLNSVDNDEPCILHDLPSSTLMMMRTLQSGQWRTLSDSLKDVISETQVTFDADGLKLVALDASHVALIHLQATAEFYYCKQEITIGLNLTQLYRMLRSLTTGGFLIEFLLTSDDPDYLRITISNSDKRVKTTHRLRLLNLADEQISIPSTTFNRVLSIPSTDFQRYIKELAGINKHIKITSTSEKLILSAEGLTGPSSIEIEATASGMHFQHRELNEDDNSVVEGIYLSRFLERFSRPLDSNVQLFLKKDYPLVLRYVLPTAVIRLVLAPEVDENDDE